MDLEKRVRLLEAAYVGVLADSVRCLYHEGILEKVTAQKKKEQIALGKIQAENFGVTRPEDVFTKLFEIFNCSPWEIIHGGKGFTARSKSCRLCAAVKRTGAGSPCEIYCLNPMEGMIKGINPDSVFEVKETLWEGKECIVEVR